MGAFLRVIECVEDVIPSTNRGRIRAENRGDRTDADEKADATGKLATRVTRRNMMCRARQQLSAKRLAATSSPVDFFIVQLLLIKHQWYLPLFVSRLGLPSELQNNLHLR